MEIKNKRIRGIWKRIKDPMPYITPYRTKSQIQKDKLLKNAKELFEKLKKKS